MKKHTLVLLVFCVALFTQSSTLFAADSETGFTSIFNGKDLAGWDGAPDLWSVQDGAITGRTSPEHPAQENTFLIWANGVVDDFELRCPFRIRPGDEHGFANSGIQYRSRIVKPSY